MSSESFPVWGGFPFFLVIVESGYLKIKNSKNHLSLIHLFLGYFKELPASKP
jgi:hypothetical protein